MKILILILAMAAAGETKDLVEAAKEAKSKRKAPSTKVITNADVRKSTGKLIVLPAKPETAVDEKAAPATSTLEQHDADYRARLELDEKLAAVAKKVAELERELEQIEYRYYEENDPDRRDQVIRQHFNEKRQQLEIARKQLEQLKPESREPGAESQQ